MLRFVCLTLMAFSALTVSVSAQLTGNVPTPRPPLVVRQDAALFEPLELSYDATGSVPSGLNERTASPDNPWLDYRLHAWCLSPSGRALSLPGFYAADGEGGNAGAIWQLRFTPDEPGQWVVFVLFEQGSQLNIKDLSVRGTSLAPSTEVRLITVDPARPMGDGFLSKGPLEAVGGRYLRHRDGTWFLKTGANSPENFLAYAGFDGTRDYGGLPRSANFVHRYPTHVQDWQAGDPNWAANGDPNAGKAIIGALNYLSSVGVNSVYFLPMNLGGDGQDTHPFIDGTDNRWYYVTHYDAGRLRQWNTVFKHAQELGVLLEFVLAENERANVTWLGNGLSAQRKLYLKQLVAHFGYHPGLRWILCEENSPEPTEEFTVAQLNDMASWIEGWSSHRHPIAVHSDPDDQRIFEQILSQGAAGGWLTSASLQVHRNYNPSTEAAVALFERYRRPAVIDMDELGPATTGVSAANHDTVRRLVLWDVLLSGGNVSWYCGYYNPPIGGDIQLEDFRTRDAMWRYSKHARDLLETLPFQDMVANDALVTGETRNSTFGDAEVFMKRGSCYVVYYADTLQTGSIDLRAEPSSSRFRGRWYNTLDGTFESGSFTINGGGQVSLPSAPNPTWRDWVLLLERQ